MIKFDSSLQVEGKTLIEIGGTSMKLAVEALSMMAGVKAAIIDRAKKEGGEELGKIDGLIFDTLLIMGLKDALDFAEGEGQDHIERPEKNIQAADFDNTEDFIKWFRGMHE